MKNYIVRYGLVGGCLSIALGLINWFFVAHNFSRGTSQVVGYLSIIAALFCIPLGIRYFRDIVNNGKMTFGQGFKVGTGITLISSIVLFFYGMLFFVFAGEDYDKWTKAGLTAEELAETQARMEQMPDYVMTPLFQGFVLFLTVFIIGAIINLISALALKSNN